MFNKTLEKLRVDKSGKKLPKKKKKEKTKDKPLKKTVSSKKTKKAKKKPIPKESAKTQIHKNKNKEKEKSKTKMETEPPLLKEVAKEDLDVLEIQDLKDQIQIIEDDMFKMTTKEESSIKLNQNALVPLLRYDLPSPSSYEGRNYVKLELPSQMFKMDIPGTETSLLKNEFYEKNQKQIKDYLTNIPAEELILDLYRLLKQYKISDLPTLPTENVEQIVQIVDTILEEKGAILEVAIDIYDKCYFWYDDKTYSVGTAANAYSSQNPKFFSIPGSQTCENIMGIGISRSNYALFWYKDETGSYGRADNSTSGSKGTYTVKFPEGKQADNVVGIAITRGDAVYYWYDDKTGSRGTSKDATAKIFNYSLADNKTPQDIAGIGIASGDRVFYWYKDGTYSIGTPEDAKTRGQNIKYYIPPDKLYTQPESTPEPEPEPDAGQSAIKEYEKYEEKYNLFRKYVDIAIDNELFPSFRTTMGGDILLNFAQRQVEPQLFFIETLRLTSFPGDYGAGSVIKTFSLLPKEQTNISVRTWKKSVTSINESSSILDSYTDEKANEFENSVQSENANASQVEQSNSYHVDAGANVSWTGGSANVSFGCEGSTNSQRQESAKVITNSIEKHSQKASAKREITVETSYEKIEEAGAEEAITRTIENLNASRTLNFIFRQMNQQFHTLLHLVDVRIGFYNGVPGSMKEFALYELESIANQYLVEKFEIEIPIKAVLQEITTEGSSSSGSSGSSTNIEIRYPLPELNRIILETYRNVHDYQSVKRSLVESVTTYNEDNEKIHEYLRVIPPKIIQERRIGQQEYALREAEDGKPAEIRSVDGIIIGKKVITMRTDGIIVEAMMGTENALDQYALEMQREEVKARRFENNRIQVGLGLINALIKDKQYQAAINAYKDIFSIKEGMKAFTEVFDKQKYIVER